MENKQNVNQQNVEQNNEQQTEVKVTLKEKIKNSLDKERKFTVGGILKTVGFIAAIPVAICVGKSIERAKNNELIEATAYDPQPTLPDNRVETIEVDVEEPVYEEVEV